MRNSKMKEREIEFVSLYQFQQIFVKNRRPEFFDFYSYIVFRFVIIKCMLKKSKIILKKKSFASKNEVMKIEFDSHN